MQHPAVLPTTAKVDYQLLPQMHHEQKCYLTPRPPPLISATNFHPAILVPNAHLAALVSDAHLAALVSNARLASPASSIQNSPAIHVIDAQTSPLDDKFL